VLPPLALADARDGAPRPLRLDGELNLIVLFAAWCAPCRVEMPRLQRLVDERAASGLRAAGIAVHLPEDLERAAVRRYLDEAKITFPTFLIDDAAYEGLESLARRAGGPGIVLPTVFVVDRERRVLAVVRGREMERLPGTVTDLLDRAGATRRRTGEGGAGASAGHRGRGTGLEQRPYCGARGRLGVNASATPTCLSAPP
jgi:thiol-disulfide isomerase/thioredoxin